MKIVQIPLLLGLIFGLNAQLVYAQPAGETATQGLTREQVKMERDEFIRTHRYDAARDNWVLKEEFEPPASMKTRAQVKAEREAFLKTHRYVSRTDTWVLIKPTSKQGKTRAQVRAETRRFLRTHEWDAFKDVWVSKESVGK
jgi:hypothetical protein